MNPRIQKLSLEIEKTRQRITTLKTKLQDLETQKDELEKTEIVAMVRSVSATPEELAAFIQAFRQTGEGSDYFLNKEEDTDENQ